MAWETRHQSQHSQYVADQLTAHLKEQPVQLMQAHIEEQNSNEEPAK